MIENDIETYFTRQVKKRGALCYKFTSPGNRAVPDRIVLFSGRTFFIELKRPGGKPRKDQLKKFKDFSKQNIHVYVIDTKDGVDQFIKKMTSEKE